jgi:hypothetical protein
MEIAEQNGRFCAGYYQNDVDQHQETEHVIELMRPDTIQYEE